MKKNFSPRSSGKTLQVPGSLIINSKTNNEVELTQLVATNMHIYNNVILNKNLFFLIRRDIISLNFFNIMIF
jgi:hypothetical protein